MDQRRKRRRLLPSARVVKKEPGEWLAPIVQDANECAGRKMLGNLILAYESEADAVKRGADHDLHVINDQRPINRNG